MVFPTKKILPIVVAVLIAYAVALQLENSQPESPATVGASGASRLSQLLGSSTEEGYETASEPRSFSFPADHGPHAGFRNEWWYFTGNLDGESGERFGYELTIFRFSVTPEAAGNRSSNWYSNQVFIGHFAITDVPGRQFHVADRYSRGSMGLSGAEAAPFRVWVEDWSVAADPAAPLSWRMHVADDAIALDLGLTPLKPPVLNGQGGLSQKSAEPGNASFYYSLSRLQTGGSVRIGARRYTVSGLSWMDREWSSSALSARQAGWDWFALQLDDGSELMFYNLRQLDGSQDPHSAGTWIDAAGEGSYLGRDEVEIEISDFWDSPLGGRYPMGWRITVPYLGLELDVAAVMTAQELSTTVRYWEGAVDVTGSRGGDLLEGRGYVELTGYAQTGGSGPADTL